MSERNCQYFLIFIHRKKVTILHETVELMVVLQLQLLPHHNCYNCLILYVEALCFKISLNEKYTCEIWMINDYCWQIFKITFKCHAYFKNCYKSTVCPSLLLCSFASASLFCRLPSSNIPPRNPFLYKSNTFLRLADLRINHSRILILEL